jgi:stage II sporulation protein D
MRVVLAVGFVGMFFALLVTASRMRLVPGMREPVPQPAAEHAPSDDAGGAASAPTIPVSAISAVSSSVVLSDEIRVCLTPTPTRSLRLAIDGPYELRELGSGISLGRGKRLREVDVRADADGVRIGSDRLPADEIEIVPAASPAVWVGDHQYRGRVRLLRQGDAVLAVNVLPLEEYIAGVVDGEMPASWPEAARRAQAIVARTYALSQAGRRHPLFDVYATTRSQMYNGFQYRSGGRRLAGETEAARRVAADTAGLACLHGGELACTYYSAVCGGRTTAGLSVFRDAAELPSVPCEWCREASRYRWTVRLTRPELAGRLRGLLMACDPGFGELKSIERTDDGFTLSDGRRRVTLSMAELRRALDLNSDRFDIEPTGDRTGFVLHGRGHGHGVGLCQWGARGQALAGRNCIEILRHYYPNADIVRLRPLRQLSSAERPK